MRNVPVKSNLVKSIYFSQDDGQLHLRLQDGVVRRFIGVPESEVNALVEAPSPGHYYIYNIRKKYSRLVA
ncbi:KTSC domain-containing protein [Rhizobium sp.]|uniref:KTSC domain-containing protein n=1 Tax=Rhizobium sp. TaxID=391 RepID=UPI0028B02C94